MTKFQKFRKEDKKVNKIIIFFQVIYLPIAGEHLVCLVNTTHPLVVGPDGLGSVNLRKKIKKNI